jgi:hypothetical protein
MNAPLQLNMFGSTIATTTSSPIGLSIILPKQCSNCGSDSAVVGSSRGPHHASLLCNCCGGHRGSLSGTTYRFLSGVIENFGRPSEPIEIRHNQSVPTTDATAQAGHRNCSDNERKTLCQMTSTTSTAPNFSVPQI